MAAALPSPRILIGPVVLLLLWQLGSATGLIAEQTLASPATTVAAAGELIGDGELQSALWVSLQRAAAGLAIGVATGLALALLSGLSRIAEDLIDGPMQILRTLPVLALVPLAILWWGIGEQVKVILIAIGTVSPIYLNVHAAIRGVDPRFVELARTVELGRLALIRRVVLPGALPGFFTGLRYSVSIAWLVLVVSEQINADAGIGFLMTQAREFGHTDVIVVGLVVYGMLGLVSDTLVRIAERRALAWRPTLAAA